MYSTKDKKMIAHLEKVIEANERINLTRIDSLEKGLVLHIEDSLIALPEVKKCPQGDYADIGSGAGYPGIPLAIRTERKTVLIESVKKKAACLSVFIEELELGDFVSVYSGRAEDLAREDPYRFSVVTARAVSKMYSLMELASPLLKINGMLICYKAHVDEDEYDKSLKIADELGFQLFSERELYLSDGETFRSIFAFKKTKKASIGLPRRNGLAQKQPLV